MGGDKKAEIKKTPNFNKMAKTFTKRATGGDLGSSLEKDSGVSEDGQSSNIHFNMEMSSNSMMD